MHNLPRHQPIVEHRNPPTVRRSNPKLRPRRPQLVLRERPPVRVSLRYHLNPVERDVPQRPRHVWVLHLPRRAAGQIQVQHSKTTGAVHGPGGAWDVEVGPDGRGGPGAEALEFCAGYAGMLAADGGHAEEGGETAGGGKAQAVVTVQGKVAEAAVVATPQHEEHVTRVEPGLHVVGVHLPHQVVISRRHLPRSQLPLVKLCDNTLRCHRVPTLLHQGLQEPAHSLFTEGLEHGGDTMSEDAQVAWKVRVPRLGGVIGVAGPAREELLPMNLPPPLETLTQCQSDSRNQC
mmetsp:Transcript_4118/g.8791  ORF Transcript_4118/g.8791 Transcript_4118/m.8791 type:complete len:290 (-) Transcript_4118:63-932(-)